MSILWIYIQNTAKTLQPLTHWLVLLYICMYVRMYMVMCPCRKQYGVCVSMARTCSLVAPVINVLRYAYGDYLLSCMHGSEIMTEVTNLSSLACFRSGTSRLGPVNGEITHKCTCPKKSYAVFTQLWFSVLYMHFSCQSTCTCTCFKVQLLQ